jgi:thymidylate synthase (FAD)
MMNQIDPLMDGISMVRLIDWMGSSLDIVCDARQSFDQTSSEWSEKDQKLLNYLVKHQHTSPFRGVVTKWQVKAPLFVCRQWWKHVIGGTFANDTLGWNEKSFRYCEADEEAYYMPREFRQQSPSNKQASSGPLEPSMNQVAMIEYAKALEQTKQAYKALLTLGCISFHCETRLTVKAKFKPMLKRLPLLPVHCSKKPSRLLIFTNLPSND